MYRHYLEECLHTLNVAIEGKAPHTLLIRLVANTEHSNKFKAIIAVAYGK